MKYCLRCQQRYPRSERYCPDDDSLLTLQDPYHLLGRTLADRYEIEALIGIGGMGAVYSARHLVLNIRVAFKILLPNLAHQGDYLLSLFTREARTASQLKHPNIVDVKDAGKTTDGIAYLVMEWLEGQNLDERLRASGPFSLDEMLALLRQIGAGLDVAHRQRIIHRDLKPSNVMLVKTQEGSDQVKILDFGLAKIIDGSAALNSAIIGTPHYASPDQFALGEKIDHRADLYSLGIMLYQLLSGVLPFQGTDAHELIRLHQTEEPPSLPLRERNVPAGIEQLIMRLLAKSPDARPASAGEVVRLFDRALNSADPHQTHPYSSPATNENQDPESNKIDLRETKEQSMARVTVADPARETDLQVNHHSNPVPSPAGVDPFQAADEPKLNDPIINNDGPKPERKQNTPAPNPISPTVRRRKLINWALIAVAGLALITVGAILFWKNAPPSPPQPTANVVEKIEALHISLDIQGRGNAIRRAGLEPIESGDGFRFHIRPREAGYLYIIAPGDRDVPTTWLTAQPDPATGVETNFLPAGTDFVFPRNDWFGMTPNETKMAFTFIFARAPLTIPNFFTARALQPLTATDQHALNALRQSATGRAAELLVTPGDPEAKVVSNRASASATDIPIVIEIPIPRR